MAIVTRSSIVNGMCETLGLQPGSDAIPRTIENSIKPVVDINIRNSTTFFSDNRSVTTSGATLFQTPIRNDFFITSAMISITKDATSDGIIAYLSIFNGGTAKRFMQVPMQTATAGTFMISLSFPYPIKVDRGTNIQIVSAFAAGTQVTFTQITGYILE
jgi:hypothetical protein